MDPLSLSNLIRRPTRTLASALGIALGVVLITTVVGLSRGMLESSSRRESRIGAELLLQPRGAFSTGLSAAPLALPTAYAERLASVPGVSAVTPVGRYLRSGAGGLGFELIEGVSFAIDPEDHGYQTVTGMQILEGRAPRAPDELVLDRVRAAESKLGVGDRLELLGRDFEVVGIFGPELGARIKLPLEALQQLLGNPERCSWFLLKLEPGAVEDQVAQAVDQSLPGHRVIFTRDIPSFYAKGLPSLRIFLRVVIGLSVVISALITLLTMYTSVHERTRELGVLKALGASRRFILAMIQREALLLSSLGALLGLVLAWLVGELLVLSTSLVVSHAPIWLIGSAAVALLGGCLGALYPALRAARLDPVEALSHE